MNSRLLAICCLLIAALANVILTILLELAEDLGATWVQTFFFFEWTFFVLTFGSWFIYSIYIYYFSALRLEMTPDYTFSEYLATLFPQKSSSSLYKKQWSVLILRGIFGVSAGACYNISLKYCESGDVILIQTATMSILTIFFGWMYFNESINYLIIVSLILAIVGMILVTQPTFIFGANDDSNTMNSIGLIIILIGGGFRAGLQAILKHTKNIQIKTETAILVPKMITAPFALVCYAIGMLIWDWELITSYNDNIWNNLILISVGAMWFLWAAMVTVGFRIGDIGRLGIISNSDIVIGYILQVIILNENDNYICYIGVALVCISCGIIFYEQIKIIESENDPSSDLHLDVKKDDEQLLMADTIDHDSATDI